MKLMLLQQKDLMRRQVLIDKFKEFWFNY